MGEWQTSNPPTDRDIEFERDGRTIERGHLTSTPVSQGSDHTDQRRQYRLGGEGPLFDVTRWREIG
ncbi:hypothetical protein [Rhizobium esperanzae]|uniref:Uncharacterized protein n=1 Tax=Rhizobium esperanzae TaxID=1967781 RepID=A0A7W6W5I5_9HYPH|nr:hypothetical protein [Rhizobium esperanzae]MBB4236669.1 hypothetical protein [Rhizobium esperanzae]